MTLRESQSAFARDMVAFLSQALALGYEVNFGEAQRPVEMQESYVRTGRSRTMDSRHIQRCAFDLQFFKDGKWLVSKQDVQPLGDLWESLSPQNSWGGNWKSFKDVPHFERKP